MTQSRELALNAALQIHRANPFGNATDVIKMAKEIEAYLTGDDAKTAGGGSDLLFPLPSMSTDQNPVGLTQ